MVLRPNRWLVPLVLMTLASCASPRAVPASRPVEAPPEVERLTRFEVGFELPERTRHPDDVSIEARFTAPSGEAVTVGGFAVAGGGFRVRFTPRETGDYR